MQRRLVVELENERARIQRFRDILAKADLRCLTIPSKPTLYDIIFNMSDGQIAILYDEMVKHWNEI